MNIILSNADDRDRKDRSLWRAGLWLPLVVVVSLAIGIELNLVGWPDIGANLRGRHSNVVVWWLSLLLMSGLGCLLSWYVFHGVWTWRRWHGDYDLLNEFFWSVFLTILVLVIWSVCLASQGSGDLMPLFVAVFCPTLAVSYVLLTLSVLRIPRLSTAGFLLAGFAILNLACQTAYGVLPDNGRELSAFFLNSLLIAIAIAIRLAVWGWLDLAKPTTETG